GDGRLRSDDRRDFVCPRKQALTRNNLADKADAKRRLRADTLIVSHQDDSQDLAIGYAPQHPGRLARRDLAEGHMRVKESRIFGADHDIALVQEIEGAAREHAMDGADDRLPDAV